MRVSGFMKDIWFRRGDDFVIYRMLASWCKRFGSQ